MTKNSPQVRKGGILLLQETHVKDENIIKMYWNMNYVSSCVSTQRAGVIILYDNSYECIETYPDNSTSLGKKTVDQCSGANLKKHVFLKKFDAN